MNGAPAKASSGTSAAELGGDEARRSRRRRRCRRARAGAGGRGRPGERSGSVGDRPGAGRDVDAEADGVGRHDDVAVEHGGVDAVAAHRLQRDLGGQLGPLDGVEDRALAADRPVLGQAAPGLAGRTRRCGSCARPAAACPSTGRSAATGRILDAIKQPDLAAEITLQPVRRYGVDAAVLYSDIVVPVARRRLRRRRRARHRPGGRRAVPRRAGPRPPAPARARGDIPYVAETVRLVAAELGPRCPLLGVRRRPVHRRQLPDRGPAVPHLRAHQGADAHRRGAVARVMDRLADHGRRRSSASSSAAGRRRSSCSTPGPARCRRPTTSATCCPTPAGVRRARRRPRRPGHPLRHRVRSPPGGAWPRPARG